MVAESQVNDSHVTFRIVAEGQLQNCHDNLRKVTESQRKNSDVNPRIVAGPGGQASAGLQPRACPGLSDSLFK